MKHRMKVLPWSLIILSSVHWIVSLLGFAPLLLSKKCLSRTLIRAMNSAMCQELAQAVSAKLALVCPASRNRGGGGHLRPLRWAALTSAAPATCYSHTENLLSSALTVLRQILYKGRTYAITLKPKSKIINTFTTITTNNSYMHVLYSAALLYLN